MQDLHIHLTNLMERTDLRLRVSREIADRSHQVVCRSRELVLRSKELLGHKEPMILASSSDRSCEPVHATPVKESLPVRSPASQAEKTFHTNAGLEVISDRRIHGELVVMDGKHFVDCELLDCTLQYSGQPVILESTRFEHCGFQFAGEAALTARFLECFQLLPERTVDYAASPSISGSVRPN